MATNKTGGWPAVLRNLKSMPDEDFMDLYGITKSDCWERYHATRRAAQQEHREWIERMRPILGASLLPEGR